MVPGFPCPWRRDPPGAHGLKAGPPRGPAAAHKPCAASAATQTRNDVGQSSCPDGPVSLPWNPVGGSPSQWDEAAARTHSRRSGRRRPGMLKSLYSCELIAGCSLLGGDSPTSRIFGSAQGSDHPWTKHSCCFTTPIVSCQGHVLSRGGGSIPGTSKAPTLHPTPVASITASAAIRELQQHQRKSRPGSPLLRILAAAMYGCDHEASAYDGRRGSRRSRVAAPPAPRPPA